MQIPDHKTKIVCTIGPASSSEEVIRGLLLAGMNVARINFSHGDFESHSEVIRRVRRVAAELDMPITILADLPGPKIRIGKLEKEPIMLHKGNFVTLTVDEILGNEKRIPVNYKQLPESVTPGSLIYLSDGFIQLRCLEISGKDVICEVLVGGQLYSHKGLNLPGAKILIDPITGNDLKILEFALNEGIDTFSISFIESVEDIRKVRDFAAARGKSVYIVAKIERRQAVENIQEILKETDALMIARGDLGVEIPIQEVPSAQKELIYSAKLLGIPVITATHMLASMTDNIRPTRAEATDVANAILDGTDAVMLSEETAVGNYPVEAVEMMAKIAKTTENWRSRTKWGLDTIIKGIMEREMSVDEVITLQVHEALQKLPVAAVLTPTRSGATPRRISRFKPDTWILAFSRVPRTCGFLTLSYGVYPVLVKETIESWEKEATEKAKKLEFVKSGDIVVFTQGPSLGKPGGTNMLKILTLE
ncbi:pyruvate kinase [Methanosarcina thermophila]|jgi:pyruvate kinase|uniref:Pyruvate kinase n=3 Tax=Methanosarcina thermophila TaxID=2210 RepID=A0A1I6YHH2_METTE|nr:pyruvate kinase [Methanosarcina thermophila]ALK05294.1 MAG: pyruvate kinase [Methanosarcina sp. 795]AKB14072.1 Pyruvate kinase [Methanosarcina thermophila TM-1]AKB15284.1 Pyruvate kinase [Methanosarcina thermophila CHTI-55]NLU56255.1 pyruvate kinase [Methanosarcina thermophila]SFT49965.1 pyruvate kinase [Methanosarcina thermophila]